MRVLFLFFSLLMLVSAKTDLGEAYSIPPCNEEMVNQTIAMGKRLEEIYKKMTPSEKADYLKFREEVNQNVIKHEQDHIVEEWTYGPYYYTILLDDRQIILCACVLYNINTPLDIRLKSTLAPKNPSSLDLINAERYREKMRKGYKTWIK